jgi:hypothetical protein
VEQRAVITLGRDAPIPERRLDVPVGCDRPGLVTAVPEDRRRVQPLGQIRHDVFRSAAPQVERRAEIGEASGERVQAVM